MNKSIKIISAAALITLFLTVFSYNLYAQSRTGSSYLNTLENNFNESSSYRALIKNIDINNKSLELHFYNGETLKSELAKDALIIKNNRNQDIADFSTGDSIIVLIDKDGKIRFMENTNNDLINEFDLKDLGFENIDLKTNKAESSFFFPVNDKIMVTDSVLSYYLQFSPLLREDSVINIAVEKQILFSSSLADIKNNQQYEEDNNTALITLPLSKLADINLVNQNVINSTINADLKVTGNRCDDINNSGLWMTILNKSQVEFKHKTFMDYDVNQFLSGNFNNLNIYLPEKIDENTAEALLKLRIYLSRNFQHLNINIMQKSNFNNSYLYDFNTRNIFIENNSNEIELDSNLNLFLGAKSAAAFTNTISDIFAADKINIKSFTNNIDSKEDYLSLKDLGYSSLNFKGIGEIRQTVNFTTADLGRLPEKIRLILNGVYTPPQKLKSVENNNSYLKIYLNDELLRVHQLSDSGEFDNLPVDFNSNLLNQENNLSFVYSYYPLGSDCAADGQYFEGTIADNSYLKLDGSKSEENINFDNILSNFSSDGILLLPEDNKFFYLKNAAEALTSFRKLDKQPIKIEVDFINENTANEFNQEKDWVFAVLPNPNYLDLNIPFRNIEENLEVESTLNENDSQLKEQFQLNAEIYNEFASWQLFKNDSKAYSIISASNKSANSQKQIENLTSSVNNTDIFRSLEGDLLLSSNNKLHNTTLVKDKEEIAINKWKIFYQKYKLILLILLLVLILTAAYWIYQNMAKMPEDK
jgi:hypothetical protein